MADDGGPPSGAALRARMSAAARAKRFQEAHRIVEQLFLVQPELIEAPILLWAAQRRTTGARLWWGHEQRKRSVEMLSRALRLSRKT